MDYLMAAHHEAGHATVTEVLGGTVERVGLEPTPHCIPDVHGMDDLSIAIICMGGAAGTVMDYGTMGPCETDIVAAQVYTDDHLAALDQAIAILKANRYLFDRHVALLIKELGPERAHDEAHICVDTVRKVMENGPQIDNNQGELL